MKTRTTSVDAGLENGQINDGKSDDLIYLTIVFGLVDKLGNFDEWRCKLAAVVITCLLICRYFPPKGGWSLTTFFEACDYV